VSMLRVILWLFIILICAAAGTPWLTIAIDHIVHRP
jgi:hypothetical protein